MPDFARWLFAVVPSVVIAGIVFVLATVGIVVAFFVFLVLFVVLGLAIRRQKKNGARFGTNGSQFIFYTNIPNGSGETDRTDGTGRTGETGQQTLEQFRRIAGVDGTFAGQPVQNDPRSASDDGQTYDLSPDDYTVEPPAGKGDSTDSTYSSAQKSTGKPPVKD